MYPFQSVRMVAAAMQTANGSHFAMKSVFLLLAHLVEAAATAMYWIVI